MDFGSGLQWNAGHTELIAPATNGQPQEAEAWVAYANASTNIFGTTNDVAIGLDVLGNDWKTAGYWAMLRAANPLGTDDGYNFLRINRIAPVGIKFWEIGNETFGTGYYTRDTGNGYSVNYAVPYPSTAHTRTGNPALSPAAYGQQVKTFSLAMKAVDPTIKIGAVVSTPLGDYSWDVDSLGQHWTPQVLSQCASNIDFIISHWYFFNGNNDNGSSLLPAPGANIPAMINGVSPHTGTSSGLKDWINQYRPGDPTNVSIFVTEFGYTGSLTNALKNFPIIGPVTALFDVDCYATWMSLGVSNICFLEMNKTGFLGDNSPLVRGETFYAIKLLHAMAVPGDMFVNSSSDTSNLRVQATRQHNGNVGLMVLNENRTASQTANITISNASLSPLGTQYQFGTNNFSVTQETPTSAPSSNLVFGVGNSFSLTLPAYTMAVLNIPIVGNTPTTVGLTSSVNPSTYGSPVTFTATVKTNGAALGGIAGDMVTFLNGTVPLGTTAVNTGGQATFITSATQLPAGADSITAVYDGDPVYSPSSNSPALSQTVNQAILTAGLTGSITKNYDGTTAATLVAGNYTLTGVFGGDTVALNNPGGTYDTRNQGTGKTVTVAGLSISGLSAANYNLTNTSVSAALGTINKTNITVTAAANTKFYDTTTNAAATPVVTSGAVQAGDTANFTESYSTPNAGIGKTLILSGNVSDGNGGTNYNYTLVSSANGTINPLTLTYMANPASMTYGSAVPALGGTITGFISGENQGNATTGTMIFTTPATSSSPAGSEPINGSGLTANNYVFAQATGNATALTIMPLTAVLTGTRAYDGTANAPAGILSVANKIGSDDVTVSLGSGTLAGPAVGSRAIISVGNLALGGTTAGNYTLSGAGGSVTITAAVVSVVSGVTANNKFYDSTTVATISLTNVTLGGVASADAANVSLSTNGYTANFATPDVGFTVQVTVSGLNLVGSAASNYTLIQPTNLSANIMSPVTVTGITVESGTVQVTFCGMNGQAYRVLASSDVTLPVGEWSVLTNGTLGSDPVTFTESIAPGTQNRFYRIAAP